jgi:hypothetical protein
MNKVEIQCSVQRCWSPKYPKGTQAAVPIDGSASAVGGIAGVQVPPKRVAHSVVRKDILFHNEEPRAIGAPMDLRILAYL